MDKILLAILRNHFFMGTMWILVGAIVAVVPYWFISRSADLPLRLHWIITGAGVILIFLGFGTIAYGMFRNLPSVRWKKSNKNSDKVNKKHRKNRN